MDLTHRSYGIEKCRKMLTRNEGRKRKIYKDIVGKQTIAVGWNIEDKGLPDEAIDLLLDIGIAEAEDTLDKLWYEWRSLSYTRQLVLIDMAFNLGLAKFRGFKKFWKALKAGHIAGACAEMVDSKWYRQVGQRAKRNVEAFRTSGVVWKGDDFIKLRPRRAKRKN